MSKRALRVSLLMRLQTDVPKRESPMTADKRSTWETYALAWKDTAKQSKLNRLKQVVDEACIYRDPTTETKGHAALVDAMLGFHQQIPGGYFDTVYFLAHHDRSIARWQMKNGAGLVVGEGISYGEYNREGKLVAMTGFFDSPAP